MKHDRSQLPPVSGQGMTPAEARLLQHFRQLKPEAKAMASDIMWRWANNPGLRKAIAFQLIDGGRA